MRALLNLSTQSWLGEEPKMNLQNNKNRDYWKDVLEGVIFSFIYGVLFIIVYAGRPSWIKYLDSALGAFLAALGAAIILFASKLIVDITLRLTASLINAYSNKHRVKLPLSRRFSKITSFLFSEETQEEVFDPIEADWNKELFDSLEQNAFWKARWITVKYIYFSIKTMLLISPIGDLIEFIKKFAK